MDELFMEAVEILEKSPSDKIDTSAFICQLKIGYGRSQRLLAELEECGYVGEPNGNQGRKILYGRRKK